MAARYRVWVQPGACGGRLHHGALKGVFTASQGQLGQDAHAPGRFPHHRDAVFVAAKGGDVLPYPAQGGLLIQQAEIGGFSQGRKAEEAQAIVEGHHDHAEGFGEMGAIVKGVLSIAIGEAASINPYPNGMGPRARGYRDIQVEAVFADVPHGAQGEGAPGALGGRRPGRQGLPALRRDGLRRLEPARSKGGLGIRYAEELVVGAAVPPLNRSGRAGYPKPFPPRAHDPLAWVRVRRGSASRHHRARLSTQLC